MESLPTNDDRRVVAFEVWRSFGGPLIDLVRAVERERKQALRNASECPPTVPELSLESPAIVPEKNGQSDGIPPHTPPTATRFEVPNSIRTALKKCPILGKFSMLWKPEYWQAAVRAYPNLDYAQVVLAAEAFVRASPSFRPRKRAGQFMNRQLQRATERQEG